MKTRPVLQLGLLATLLVYCVVLYHRRGREQLLQPATCAASAQPERHIFFLKMHKCGSSTVENILMRWGLERQLNFVLPVKGHYLGHPELFGKSVIDPRYFKKGEHFDICTHHTRFSVDGVAQVMPGGTKKVTILREPVSLFESLYNYYRLSRGGYGDSLVQMLDMDLDALQMKSRVAPRWGNSIGFNQMAFDLGLSPWLFDDDKAVNDLIAMMEEEFDLVLISEHMEASMVLLSELMCWPLSDLTYLKLNARPSHSHHTILNDEQRQKLQVLNSADVRIYEHFKAKFEQRLDRVGRDLVQNRVKLLTELNDDLRHTCIEGVTDPDNAAKGQRAPGDYPVVTYQIFEDAPDICGTITMDEIKFTQLLRDVQLERFGYFGDFEDTETEKAEPQKVWVSQVLP